MNDNNLKDRIKFVINMLIVNMDQQDAAKFKKLVQQYLNQYMNNGTLILLNTGDDQMDQLAYHVVDDLTNEDQQEIVSQAQELLQDQLQKAGRSKGGKKLGKKRAGNRWDRWDNDWNDGEWWDWDWNDWGWNDWDNYWYNPYYSYYYYNSWYPYYWWGYNPYSWYDWYYPNYWGYSYVGGRKAGKQKKRAGCGDLFNEISFKDIKEMHMTCNANDLCTINVQFQKNGNSSNLLEMVEEDM